MVVAVHQQEIIKVQAVVVEQARQVKQDLEIQRVLAVLVEQVQHHL
jgi:hypothetical protein